MENTEKAYEAIDEWMAGNHLSILGLLKHKKQKLDKLFKMTDEVKERYDGIYEQLNRDFENYRENKKHIFTAQQRGSLFEEMIGCLFFSGDTLLFHQVFNCRTSTNEIDILIRWSDVAVQNQIDTIYDYIGRSFLCECKHYEDGVGVTYVGKFYSLLQANSSKFGILFVSTRVKGRNRWDSAQGLIRKLALRDRTYIIAVEWEDLTNIYRGETNILSLIRDKYHALKNDIEYDKYIEKHEMLDEFLIKLERDAKTEG